MKIKRTALFAALLATVIGAQAEVTLQPDNNGGRTNQFIYAFTNVVEGTSSVTGAPRNVSGSFTAGSGGFSVTVTAKEDWSQSLAQDAVNTTNFNTYFTGLGYTNVASISSDDWGVFSSGETSGSTASERLDGGEVLIFTFDTTDLDGELRLNSAFFEISPGGKKRDALLCTSSNTVIDAAWNVGGESASLPSYPYAINNGDKLIIAQVSGEVRLSNIKFDVFPAPTGGLIAPEVSATAGYRTVDLDWLDEPNTNLLDSYTVYRSLAETNGFAAIASNLTASAYTDTDVDTDVTYYYQVSAIDTNESETTGLNTASATPFVPVATGLVVDLFDDGEVNMDWDDTTNIWFASYSVYRKEIDAPGYDIVASNLTESMFTDSNVVNEVAYLYAVSNVDTNGDESALNGGVYAEPTADLVVLNLNGNQQKEIRTVADGTGTNWVGVGTKALGAKRRIGGYGFGELGRYVMKFPLQESDLGDKTAGDISEAVLRVRVTQNDLIAEPSPGSSVEVYSSQTVTANTAVVISDFENASFSLVGDIDGLTNGTPEGQWYEIDVTAAVLADLGGDVQDGTAGSVFRLQLNDDLLTPVGNIKNVEINIYDDETKFAPQLRIKFGGATPPYDVWAQKWLPADVSDETGDNDGDGLSNLGEYAINGNPTNAADRGQTSLSQDGSVFTYIYASNTVDSALTYRLIDSADLVGGPFGTNNNAVAGVGPAVDDYASVTNTYGMSTDTLFINLEVEK